MASDGGPTVARLKGGSSSFISYKLENDIIVSDQLLRAGQVVSDMRPLFKEISRLIRQSRKAIFKLKGPGAYPDFKGPKVGETGMTAYQNRKHKEYGNRGYPLLRATGRLEKSITELGGENISLPLKDGLVFGTMVPYGVFHQEGPDGGGRKVPLRKFLFIGPEAPKFARHINQDLVARINNTVNTFVLRSMGAPTKAAPSGEEG